MKKNKQTSKDNIIPFPKLEERLLDRGMEALKDSQYKHALQIFNQLSEYNRDQYPEVEIGIVVCLLELGLYEDAKDKCERLLKEDVGDYFNIIQIYITILIQQSEFSEVVTLLETLFEEERIPPEHAEELFHLLEFSRKSIENNIDQEIPIVYIDDIAQQLLNGSIEEQLQVIQKLRNEPALIKIIDTIKLVLENDKSHPIIQSMLLHLIMERQINDIFVINKFQRTMTVKLSDLKNIFDQSFTVEVLNILDDILGIENPTLFDNVKQLWERYLFAIYPFQPEVQQARSWAAALHKLGYELFGIDISDHELKAIYDVNNKVVASAYKQLVEAEKISVT